MEVGTPICRGSPFTEREEDERLLEQTLAMSQWSLHSCAFPGHISQVHLVHRSCPQFWHAACTPDQWRFSLLCKSKSCWLCNFLNTLSALIIKRVFSLQLLLMVFVWTSLVFIFHPTQSQLEQGYKLGKIWNLLALSFILSSF